MSSSSNMQNLNPHDQEEEEEEDFISRLPDDVLISILSLVPTKEALTTSVLSKRWTHLFRFMPNLAFWRSGCKHPCTCDSEEFITGAHNVLQRHSACIRYFKFRCCLPESCAHKIEQCIVPLLGNLCIRKLRLCLVRYTESKCIKLPFSCHLLSLMPSLQSFALTFGSLQLPSLNYNNPCNSLKTIRLSRVSASPGSLEYILSNCLSLCGLALRRCELPSKLCFPRLVNLQLKCIAIRHCEGLKEIDFYAANLTAFYLDCQKPVNLIFDYAPQLQSVFLSSATADVSYFCGRLAQYVPTLKTLLLVDIKDLYQDGSIAMGKNMFNNLKRLELSVYANKINLFSLIRVVHECPRLEDFQLVARADLYKWPKEESPVIIVHSQLKGWEISGFGGSESEVGFVAYILRSAVELQKMIISWHSSKYLRYGKWEASKHHPVSSRKEWSEVYECIQQMKHEAVSKTLQVVAQEFPKTQSRQFKMKSN